MMHRAWSSIVEVPYCLSRSYVKFQGHTALKSVEFDPNWAFPDCNSSLNSPMAMKCCTKLETAKERCHIVFQGHPSNFKVTGDKTTDYDPNWAFPDYRPVAAFKSLRFALFKSIWKIPTASGHSRRPFTSCRTRPSWHNWSSLGPYVLNGYGSMTLATTNTVYGKRDPALVDMWGTSYQNMKYQSSLRRRVITGGSEKAVRVSRRMDCGIGVIKFYISVNN